MLFPVSKSDTIDWVDLSKCETEIPGLAETAGWGIIHVVRNPNMMKLSNYLKKVLLNVINHEACKNKINEHNILDETLLCAFGVNVFENVAKVNSTFSNSLEVKLYTVNFKFWCNNSFFTLGR